MEKTLKKPLEKHMKINKILSAIIAKTISINKILKLRAFTFIAE